MAKLKGGTRIYGDIKIDGGIYDSSNQVGAAGSVLISTGTGIAWTTSTAGGGLAAISISTNTTNSNQLIPYTTTFGNTTGFGATNSFVINPSTGNLGIGSTSPNVKLSVVGNANITGVVTATTFVGNLTGTATTATNLSDAANITTGTINSARLSGTYNINVAYANTSGIATYATSSGIATYATSSGIATYATTAGISTYATTAGIATNVIGGIGSIAQLQVTGISTFSNGPVFIGSASSTGTASQSLQVTGGAYVSGNLGIGTTNPQSKLEVNGVLGFGVFTGAYSERTNIRIGNNTTGSNITSGWDNIFIGIGAGSSTSSGDYNNFFGRCAGEHNTTGKHNNFFGKYTGRANTEGTYNNFFGTESGESNITGKYNNFFGYQSGRYNTTGTKNTFVGTYAGFANTSGSYNSFFGYYSGGDNTTASHKVIIGNGFGAAGEFDAPDPNKDKQFAVGFNTSGNSEYWLVGNENLNVGIGTTSPTEKFHVVGNTLVNGNITADNYTGKLSGIGFNFFGGKDAGFNNTTGNSNTFIGAYSGYDNTIGKYNVFVGGEEAGFRNTSGSYNQFYGSYSGYYNETGSSNSFFGSYNGISTSASYKVIIGSGTGFSNVFDSPDINKNKQFAVGLNTTGTSEYWLVGNENLNVGIGTTNPTTKLEVGGTVKATSFVGDGSALTGITASGTSIAVQDDGVSVGAASTINFADNLSITFVNGVARVSGFTTTAAGILRTVTKYTATAGQTSFTVTYVVGYVDVFLNGVRLSDSEYTATNGTSIVLNEGASLDDVVEIVAFSVNLTSVTNSTNVIGGIGSITQLSVSGVTTSGRFITTAANSITTGGGQIYLNGANGNRIDFNGNGIAGPSTSSRSAGTKITVFPQVSATEVDYAIGIEGSTIWQSVPLGIGSYVHRWYGGTTQIMDLKGSGELILGTSIPTGTPSQRLQITGNAYVSGNLGIGITNPQTKLDVGGELKLGRIDAINEGGQISFGRSSDNSSVWSIDVYGTTSKPNLRFVDNIAGATRAQFDGTGKLSIGANLTPTANLHVGVATTSAANSAPFKIDSGGTANLLATPEAGAMEYDGTNLYITPTTSYGRAAIPLTLYNSGSGTTGITGSTNYAMFPAASDTITLPVGTYYVKIRFRAAVSGSTTSGTLAVNIRGAGNAVGTFSWSGSSSILDGSAANIYMVDSTALGTNIVVTAASIANPRQYNVLGEGILKITTQGTIIPAYQYSATLTSGTTTLTADNYMVIHSIDTRSNAAFGPIGSGWG